MILHNLSITFAYIGSSKQVFLIQIYYGLLRIAVVGILYFIM